MRRPRWHDLLITLAFLGVAAVGVWALWWDDLRVALDLAPDKPAPTDPVPATSGQT